MNINKPIFSIQQRAIRSGLMVLVLMSALMWGIPLQTQAFQPPTIQLFSTIQDPSPQGQVVRVDLSFLGTFPVLGNLDFPDDVLCHPNGTLFVTNIGPREMISMNSNGGSVFRRTMANTPDALAIDVSGDLFVGTRAGTIFVFPGGDLAADPDFLGEISFVPDVFAFLTTGPFAGDLLALNNNFRSIMRISLSDLSETPFITLNSANVSNNDRFVGMTIHPDGHVFVANFDAGEILEFNDDGTLVGTYLSAQFPNQLVFDSSGTLYFTNQVFLSGGQTRGGILIAAPDGTVTTSIRTDGSRGIAVCES